MTTKNKSEKIFQKGGRSSNKKEGGQQLQQHQHQLRKEKGKWKRSRKQGKDSNSNRKKITTPSYINREKTTIYIWYQGKD